MWLRMIAPYIGESETDKEPFDEWFARVTKHVPHVPEDVADQWVHENWGGSPYEFLPIEQLTFERQSWSLADLKRVRFGESWGENPSDLERLDNEDNQESELGQYMLAEKTWPRPILVLDNQHGLSSGSEKLARWHLIEGHMRLTYLRCLDHKGIALPQHDVWVLKAPAKLPVATDDGSHNPQPTYAHEKLTNAIRYLAISSGSIQARMQRVLRYSGIERLDRNHFPGDMRERWDLLVRSWDQLANERAAYHFAREVIEFYEWVCMRLGTSRFDDRRKAKPTRR